VEMQIHDDSKGKVPLDDMRG